MLTSHNKMLDAQIAQEASFSSRPPDRLPSKPESNLREHCNRVTLKDGLEDPIDPEDSPFGEGREKNIVKIKERNDGGKAVTLTENESLEIPTCFPPKFPDPCSFSIPCMVGKFKTERALYDLGVRVNLMPCSFFHRHHLRPLQPHDFH